MNKLFSLNYKYFSKLLCFGKFINFHYSFVETVQLKEDVKWVKINHEQTGYYRVLYNKDNWDGLIEQLHTDHKVFSSKVKHNLN